MKLEVIELSKSYGKKEVLKDVNITFEEGKIYGLLGRNGAGKTTFFNSLNEDIEIDSGEFKLDEEVLNTDDIGYATATPIVPEFLTGKEFLQFFLDINEKRIGKRKSIDDYFELVQLTKEDQDVLLKE